MARAKKPPEARKRAENGVFYVYVNGDRKQSLGTKDAKEAEERFRRWMNLQVELDSVSDIPAMTAILEYYLDQHINGQKEDGSFFVEDRERGAIIHRWGTQFFAGMRVSEIDKDVIKSYLRMRRSGQIGKSAQNGTLRRELGYFTAACHWMVESVEPVSVRMPVGLIPPFKAMMPEKPPAKDRVILEDEMLSMLNHAGTWTTGMLKDDRMPRIERFLWLAFETGARGGVIECLSWPQVNLKTDLIDLHPPGRPRTKKRNPIVPISDRLKPILERAWDERISDKWVLDSSGAIRKAFENFCKRWGYEGITKHTLRHSFCTQSAMAGVPMIEIAAMVGDDVRTIEKNYLHFAPDYLRGAINARVSSDADSGHLARKLAS